MKRGALYRTMALAIWLVAVSGGGVSCSRAPEPTIAPDTTFFLLDDTPITLENRLGKPTLVVFLALNNPLALAELKRLEPLTAEFAHTGIELIAVAQSSDRPELARTVMYQEQSLVPVAMDPDGRAATAFGGVSTTPSVFLVSATGKLVYASEGPADPDVLRTRLATP